MKKGKGKNGGLLPNSLKIISSCLKTVSTNASTVVRSAGASIAASVSASGGGCKDQVTWAGFGKLVIGPGSYKHVLLLGYQNGFQVFDVQDAANFNELVSKRNGLVTFLQVLPIPAKSDSDEGFRLSHPLLLVVARDEANSLSLGHNSCQLGGSVRDGTAGSQSGSYVDSHTVVQFYSLRTNCFVKLLRFRSAVCMVRCSPRIVAVGLPTQICCIDALTLEKKFSVLTYPVPQFGGQGKVGVNVGYGPMAVGPRWLAYASDNPLISNSGRLSPKNLTPSLGVSPSSSPGGSSLVARYAMESSQQLATGIMNLGDMGYRTLSRYCQELLPNGPSSPVPSRSGWKFAGHTAPEAENAGMVVVKDFVSRAVISQFRAHTSPISALCFDPSGTLLVTASVYGNNVNIFRIMPSPMHNGSSDEKYDWSSAHVHLYKLYRGITSAIIQDICFSHHSQWIAVISSKGTCHIYTLSPFGGDTGLQSFNSHSEQPFFYPVLPLPWWSTSSFFVNQPSSLPPPPVTLYVVCRIKDSNSGVLNSVSNAALSVAGNVYMPSGAVAAIFHNSMLVSIQDVQSRSNSLEHLLVYAPSGHIVQYELLPAVGVESRDNGFVSRSDSHLHAQNDALRVKVEPMEYWNVCRRSDSPEREEPIYETAFGRQAAEIIDSEINSNFGGRKTARSGSVKSNEKAHLHLSNAEVQINSGRLPIWQKSEIRFHTVVLPSVKAYVGGEIEIEKFQLHKVEIKQKDLLPVFDHFHSMKSNFNDRGFPGGRYPIASAFMADQVGEKVMEETVICHSKPASLSSTEGSDGGSSRRNENLLDLDQMNDEKPIIPFGDPVNKLYLQRTESTGLETSLLDQKLLSFASLPSDHLKNDFYTDSSITNELSSAESNLSFERCISEAARTPDNCGTKKALVSNLEPFHSATDGITSASSGPAKLQNLVDFVGAFHDGSCEGLELDQCHGLTEVVVACDINHSDSQSEKDKPEEDGENDLLGGMLSFSD